MDQEEIFAHPAIHEQCVSGVYKDLSEFNHKNTNNLVKKLRRRTEQTFFQSGNVNSRQAYEKMLSPASHQGDADQKHSECHRSPVRTATPTRASNRGRSGRAEQSPCTRLGGMQAGASTEGSLRVSRRMKS